MTCGATNVVQFSTEMPSPNEAELEFGAYKSTFRVL
jgi:hypothetical protein